MFSATLTKDIAKLANIALNKPIHISDNQEKTTCIEHIIHIDADSDIKREQIAIFMAIRHFIGKVIIFCNTKHEVHRLHILFKFFSIPSIELHGFLS